MEKNKIKISEIFESIQGEGKFSGTPMLFIRTYGCTRRCPWCDTRYAIEGNKYKEMTINEIVKMIKSSKLNYVCYTGGEPEIWKKQIKEIIIKTKNKQHHLETNGDLLQDSDFNLFDYIAISPKDLKTIKKLKEIKVCSLNKYDIKIVTDLDKVGKDMLKYATMLMPLTTYNKKKDLEIQRKVWNYCVKHNLKFTPRYQIWLFGKKRGV